MIDIVFAVGEHVQHIFTKDHLLILKTSKHKVLCRTKDLREIWFYKYELEDKTGVDRVPSRFL